MILNGKIDFINNIKDDYRLDINEKYLRDLLRKACRYFKKKSEFYRLLDSNCGKVGGWINKYGTKSSIKFCDYKKLISLLNIKSEEANKNIKGFKISRNGKFVKLRRIIINEEFLRFVGFILGDGSIEKSRVRMSNTEISVIKHLLDYLNKLGLSYLIKIKLVIPESYSKNQLRESKKVWVNELNKDIDYVYYRKNKVKVEGKDVVFKKECIEIAIESKTFAIKFKEIIPKIKNYILNDIQLQKSYLQGIYAAEGSIMFSNKNKLRMVQIGMKNKKEIEYIQKLLTNLDILNSGVKRDKDIWYIYITNYNNLKKLENIDLFFLHNFKREKLFQILEGYQRTQTIARNRGYRYNQIKSLIKKYKKISSIESTKILDTSLCRTQVLLRDGWLKNHWNRIWNGKEFIYYPKK